MPMPRPVVACGEPGRLVVEVDDGTRGMADIGGGGPWIFPGGHQRRGDPSKPRPRRSLQ